MSSNTIRVGASIPLAIVVTIALFWLMNYLITHGMDAITEEVQGSAIDFTRVDRDETVQAKDRALPDRPDKPDAPPPPPPPPFAGRFPGGDWFSCPSLLSSDRNRSRFSLFV